MVIGSKELIRDINNSAVLETIIKEAPLSRVDIAKSTGLTKGTISTIVQNLMDIDLLVETGMVSNGIGRKSTLLMLNKNCGYSLTINIEKHALHLLACDICGQKIYSAAKNYTYTENFNFADEIIKLIDRCVSQLPLTTYNIIGISLSVPGIVKNNKLMFSNIPELLKYNFEKALDKYYAPIFIYNNAHFGVLGENLYSMRAKNMALINCGSSISMGIITDSKLFCGSNGQACNLGHMIIETNGKQCPCGQQGCLEQYASVTSVLSTVSEAKNHNVSFEEFCCLFKAKDKDAHDAATQFIKYMSCGINNVIKLYDPEIIVLNSPFTIHFDEIFIRLKNSLDKNKGILYRAMLKNDAALYGGAVINIINFLKIDNFTPSMCYLSRTKIL